MITLTKNGNAIVFTFSDNAHYLFDGTIEVPVNSLTLVTDNSQMATFKKSASNDIFISATYAELGMSKSELESWFKENACGSTGGGGVTSGEVETMIETSLEDYYDIDEVDAALSAKANTATTYTKTEVDTALANKADTATTYTKTEVDNALGDKADTSAVTASIAAAVSGKQDTLIAGSGITISGNVISSEGGGVTVDPSLDSGSTNPVANSAITAAIDTKQDISKLPYYIYSNANGYGSNRYLAIAKRDRRTGADSTDLISFARINNKGLVKSDDVFSLVETSAITSSITSASTNAEVAGAKAVYDAIQAGGGGGATYSAGTNISIDSANTINCTLPISVGTGNYLLLFNDNTNNIYSTSRTGFILGSQNGIYKPIKSNSPFIIGDWNEATANSPFIHGHSCKAKGLRNFISGYKLNANNSEEAAFGEWNNSVSGSSTFGYSGNTLFSVGNGTADNARHNAFEIRQNGDIYITSGGTDILLQDALGGGGGVSESAFTSYSAATDARISEDEEVTAAALNALNDGKQDTLIAGSGITISGNVISAEGGNLVIELTQAEYDALVDKDPNAFYIITDATEINISDYYTSAQTQSAINAAVSGKQDTLIAGSGITISGNVISANGGGSITVDTALDSGSTNPVENRVIYDKFDEVEQVTAAALNALNDKFDGLRLKKLTQAEYEALTVKDNNTLYILVG